ncbi:hypothetical protein [Pseudomonas sp. LRF_L74]|uniref:hypothetical protein n=1 Tax=Pseudomonas sp. LRF_L74 TaxID=3369422 RepID=UPI003F62D50A
MNSRQLSFVLLGNSVLATAALALALAGQLREERLPIVQMAPSTPQVMHLSQTDSLPASERSGDIQAWNEQPRQERWVF